MISYTWALYSCANTSPVCITIYQLVHPIWQQLQLQQQNNVWGRNWIYCRPGMAMTMKSHIYRCSMFRILHYSYHSSILRWHSGPHLPLHLNNNEWENVNEMALFWAPDTFLMGFSIKCQDSHTNPFICRDVSKSLTPLQWAAVKPDSWTCIPRWIKPAYITEPTRSSDTMRRRSLKSTVI